MSEAKPLSCPFCGKEPLAYSLRRGHFYIACPSRGVHPTFGHYARVIVQSGGKEEAVAAWNTRPAPPAPSEAVREALECAESEIHAPGSGCPCVNTLAAEVRRLSQPSEEERSAGDIYPTIRRLSAPKSEEGA